MFGYGGYGMGRSWRGAAGWWLKPEGYTYLGPCRCGFGPHGFWQERSTGRIFRGFPSYGGWRVSPLAYAHSEAEDLRSELNWLKKEKENLEIKIEELEAELQKVKEEV